MVRFVVYYLFLLEALNDPDMFIRFIKTTFIFGLLRNIYWVAKTLPWYFSHILLHQVSYQPSIFLNQTDPQ